MSADFLWLATAAVYLHDAGLLVTVFLHVIYSRCLLHFLFCFRCMIYFVLRFFGLHAAVQAAVRISDVGEYAISSDHLKLLSIFQTQIGFQGFLQVNL